MEPLEHVHNYRVIDYDDIEAARQGLLDLSCQLERDEEQVDLQRQAIAGKYGLKKMVKTIVQVYGEQGVSIET
jgi:hypothetical protein